jgi:hypothetical protein
MPGTTLIEGNWDSASKKIDWSRPKAVVPNSLFLSKKPAWFGALAWPPVSASATASDEAAIIPAAYRVVNGRDP